MSHTIKEGLVKRHHCVASSACSDLALSVNSMRLCEKCLASKRAVFANFYTNWSFDQLTCLSINLFKRHEQNGYTNNWKVKRTARIAYWSMEKRWCEALPNEKPCFLRLEQHPMQLSVIIGIAYLPISDAREKKTGPKLAEQYIIESNGKSELSNLLLPNSKISMPGFPFSWRRMV